MQDDTLNLLSQTPLIQAHPVISGKLPQLTAMILDVRRLAHDQRQSIEGTIAGRIHAMETAQATALALSRLICAYARRHGLLELEKKVDLSATDFARERLIVRLGPAHRMLATAREHSAGLAEEGVTPEMLDVFAAEIAKAQAAIDRARSAQVERQTATALLSRAVRAVSDFLHYQIDPHVLLLWSTDREFCALYRITRTVRKRPGRRCRSGAATPAAAPLALPAAAPALPAPALALPAGPAVALPPLLLPASEPHAA